MRRTRALMTLPSLAAVVLPDPARAAGQAATPLAPPAASMAAGTWTELAGATVAGYENLSEIDLGV